MRVKKNKIMEKLISMVDFVLQFGKEENRCNYEQAYDKISAYANLLKQHLTLGMFVPTDLNGNVLEKPEKKWYTSDNGTPELDYSIIEVEEYQEAKERCIFEGFVVSENDGNTIVTNGRTSILFSIRKLIKHVESSSYLQYIEDVSKLDFILSETAKKQLS